MTTVTYIIPRTLLAHASTVLQPAEQVRFVTGIEFSKDIIVLTQLLTVRAERGITHAKPDPASIARLQQRLWLFGQDIMAQFHSHPGNGPHSTHPSNTDKETARRWENGCSFLGAIFSSDGRYVRFFNHEQHSTVHIHGKHYTQLEPQLFELHDPDVQTQEEPPGDTDGPTRTNPVVEPTTHE